MRSAKPLSKTFALHRLRSSFGLPEITFVRTCDLIGYRGLTLHNLRDHYGIEIAAMLPVPERNALLLFRSSKNLRVKLSLNQSAKTDSSPSTFNPLFVALMLVPSIFIYLMEFSSHYIVVTREEHNTNHKIMILNLH